MSSDALAECVQADEEGQGLGVGSAVGKGAIGANARVGEGSLESGLVAIIGCRTGKVGRKHGSDEYLLGHKC